MTYLLRAAIRRDGGLRLVEDPYKQAQEVINEYDHYINVIVDRALRNDPELSVKHDAAYWREHPVHWIKEAKTPAPRNQLSAIVYGLVFVMFAVIVLMVALSAIIGRAQFHISTALLVPLAFSLFAISAGLFGVASAFFFPLFHRRRHPEQVRYKQGRLRYLSALVVAGGTWVMCAVWALDRHLTAEVTLATVEDVQTFQGRCEKPWYLWIVAARGNRTKPCFEFKAAVSFHSVAGHRIGSIDAGSCYLDEGLDCEPYFQKSDQVQVRYYRGSVDVDTFTNNWGLLTFVSIAGVFFVLLIPTFRVQKKRLV